MNSLKNRTIDSVKNYQTDDNIFINDLESQKYNVKIPSRNKDIVNIKEKKLDKINGEEDQIIKKEIENKKHKIVLSKDNS